MPNFTVKLEEVKNAKIITLKTSLNCKIVSPFTDEHTLLAFTGINLTATVLKNYKFFFKKQDCKKLLFFSTKFKRRKNHKNFS